MAPQIFRVSGKPLDIAIILLKKSGIDSSHFIYFVNYCFTDKRAYYFIIIIFYYSR